MSAAPFHNYSRLVKRKWLNPERLFSVRNSTTAFRYYFAVWIKKVEAAKWEAQRPAEKSEQKHTERINEVERERFALVKHIDELELASQQFNAIHEEAVDQLNRLKNSNEKSKQLVINPIE